MKTRTCATLLIATHLAGCATIHPVERPAAGTGFAVAAGDVVQITTNTGRRVELEVARVSAEEVCGSAHCVPASEIASMARVDAAPAKTLLIVLAVVVIAAAVVAASSSIAFMPGAPVFP